jgi:hypothetical protein
MLNSKSWCAFLVLASACAPSVRLQVLQPADIMVPSSVEVIAVVDRSKAKNFGQGVLGVLEGAISGESIGADTEGRIGAVEGVRDLLMESPRFEVVEPGAVELDSSLFDTVMPWKEGKQICKSASCNAIVALEALDSDGVTTVEVHKSTETVDGKERVITSFEAIRETTVLTAWRLYDVDNKQVIDDLRNHTYSVSSSFMADTEDDAIYGLPDDNQTVRDAAFIAGEMYGRRIAPSYIIVTRTFFGKGDDRMKEARDMALADQWAKASKIWTRVFESTDDAKLKGQAAYNLALAAEVKGDLGAAMAWQDKAARNWPKGKILRYGATLDYRVHDAQRLDDQMGVEE